MKEKKSYVKPQIEILEVHYEESVMIAVSGTTTPEESQAKQYNLWTDDEDDVWTHKSSNLWDDEDETEY